MHCHPLKTSLVCLVIHLAVLPTVAAADGPKDNVATDVRPVPPPGIALTGTDRKTLEIGLAELGQAINTIKGSKPNVHLADVEIFYRAVATALLHNEFLEATDVGRALALLTEGKARAKAMVNNQHPWLTRPGFTVLGYVSELDGTVQPYGLYLPVGFSPLATQPFRLDTWFHGRGEKLTEVNFISSAMKNAGEFVRPDAMILAPYGRFCNGSKLAGEVDFFEALADVQQRFRIDEDRIVIRGFSLGGASAWHLGAHFASRWAAVAPGAGFSETPDFLKVFQNETLTPTWYEQTLWQMYDAPVYAANFRNVPTIAYSGAKDSQKQAADVMEKALIPVGVKLVHVIGPDTQHKYHPDSKDRINHLVDALVTQGRTAVPRRVSIATPTLRYNRQAWLAIEGMVHHFQTATADGELVGDSEIRVTTKNVTALGVEFPTGKAPFFAGKPPTITIDGQRISGDLAPIGSDRAWAVGMEKRGGRWVLAGPAMAGELRKRHGLQGPIDDAFLSSFLFVTPTGHPMHPNLSGWVRSEQSRAIREWRRQFRGDARVKRDRDVSADDVAAHNIVLWGDPGSNRVLSSVVQQLPVKWTDAGIQVGGTTYAPDKHALIMVYPNPFNPRRYVVINSGPTYREYDYLNNARQVPRLPDWAVVDTSEAPGPRFPGKVVNADFFGENWELQPSRKNPSGPRYP